MQTTDRWTEICAIWKSNQWLYAVVGFFAGLLCFPALQAIRTDLGELLQGFVPEAVGIGFTVLIIDRLYQSREEARRIRDLKAQLVRDAGSQSNEAALRAVNEITRQGWLTGEDGLLKGANLANAKLQGVNLKQANLQGANLFAADLQGASLLGTHLQWANLMATKLQRAKLRFAKLQGADLIAAKLQEADLMQSNLQGANLGTANLQRANLNSTKLKETNLRRANLQDANLDQAQFDENTILPDGNYWTSDTDLKRFTDPDHADFWRSDEPTSPAWRGQA